MHQITRSLAASEMFAPLLRWRRQRRMAAALESLDDATLKDIGVPRGEIPSIVRARCATGGRV
ncbi:MAG: DUF1127 domain-containing protein [Acetobacteraceae bacterium]|nr:DUF1127 domain-containing protein [Acetobacteraceae bacterium]